MKDTEETAPDTGDTRDLTAVAQSPVRDLAQSSTEDSVTQLQPPKTSPTLPAPAGSMQVTVLAVLAIVCALYFGATLLMPIAMAVYLNLLLSPLKVRLGRLGVPSAIAAAAVMVAFLVALFATVNLVSKPAQEWLDLTPRNLQQLRDSLSSLSEPLEEIQEISDKVDDITELANNDANPVPTIAIEEPGLMESVAAMLPVSMTALGIIIFLTFFLLASTGRLFEKLDQLQTSRVQQAVPLLRRAETDISKYLLTITFINALLGLAVAGCTYLVGFEDPWLWGVIAGVMNFIPYIGPLITLGILTFVGLLTFNEPQTVAIVPLFYLFATTLEGQVLTPMIIGERLSLSPVTVFLSLVFWGWLWGPLGMILAVPILLALRVALPYAGPLSPLTLLIDK